MANGRPTKATFKAFLRRNNGNLLIKVLREFDGMVDGCVSTGEKFFTPALPAERPMEHNQGVQGIWLVGHGGDYFERISENGFEGFHVYNSCGSFDVAVKVPG